VWQNKNAKSMLQLAINGGKTLEKENSNKGGGIDLLLDIIIRNRNPYVFVGY
jgi:hypothetical protein